MILHCFQTVSKAQPNIFNYFLFFQVRQRIKLKQSKKIWIWMINILQVREIIQKRDG